MTKLAAMLYVKVNELSIMLSLFSDVERKNYPYLLYRGGRFFVSKQNTSENPISLKLLMLCTVPNNSGLFEI